MLLGRREVAGESRDHKGAQHRGPVSGCPRVYWNGGRSPARSVLVGVPGRGRCFQEAVSGSVISGSLEGGGDMWPWPLSMVWSAARLDTPSLVRRLGLQLPGTSGVVLGPMGLCHLGKTAG